jgi:DNA (cytosine-5)-methyltransferase 1
MENVTQVHGKKNIEHFNEWIAFLESKGYRNYWKDLNAKNFCIPQNRNRTFMVSVLGDYTYEFPQEFPLNKRLKDLLEKEVDEKFYISNERVESIVNSTFAQEKTRIQKTELARDYKDPKCVEVGVLTGGKWDKMHDVSRRVYSGEGVSPTIHTCGGGNTEPKVVEPAINVVGNYSPSGHDASRIVDVGGLAPTVKENHGTVTAVLEPLAYDEQNGYIRKDGTVGTLTTDESSPKHNNRVIEFAKEVVNSGVLETESAEIYSYDGYNNKINKSDCIGTVVPQNSRWGLTNGYKIVEVEPNNKTIENCYVSEKGVKYILDSKRGMATDVNADICQPLTAKGQANWTGSFVSPDIESIEKSSTIGSTEPTKINLKNGETITSNDNLSSLRIRKLTPKECWRLMGFTDEDFEKAAQYNSNSQLYKQAGNSIVVSVLYYIFKEML